MVARILVVDDAAFMRMMMKTILQGGGHDVVAEAGNGLDAIHQYSQHQPDLVTMDITMPEMDGIQAVKEIVERHPTAKVIMCSAMGQQQMILDAVRVGAKGFIVKPFDKDRVLAEVKKLL